MSHLDDEPVNPSDPGYFGAEWDTDGHASEDTIFAWLDGALSPSDRELVEAHVHACAPCSIAVAEARGFIAASARIVGSLDAVSRNVVPREDVARTASNIVSMADARAAKSAALSPRPRAWYTRSATKIAAGLVLMLGGTTYVTTRASKGDATRRDTSDSVTAAPLSAAANAGTSASIAAALPAAPPATLKATPELASRALADRVADAPANPKPLLASAERDAESEKKSERVAAANDVTFRRDARVNTMPAPAQPVTEARGKVAADSGIAARAAAGVVGGMTAANAGGTAFGVAGGRAVGPGGVVGAGGAARGVEKSAIAIVAAAPPSAPVALSTAQASAPMTASRSFTEPAQTSSVSANRTTVTGVVTDSGRAVANANVFVVGTPIVATTDSAGQFTLRNVPRDAKELEARRIGYGGQRVALESLRSDSSSVNFKLTLRPSLLDEVTVLPQVAERSPTSGARCFTPTASASSLAFRALSGVLGAPGKYSLNVLGWPTRDDNTAGAFELKADGSLRGVATSGETRLEFVLMASDATHYAGTVRLQRRGAPVRTDSVMLVSASGSVACGK